MAKSWYTKGYVGYADTVGDSVTVGRDGRAHRVGADPVSPIPPQGPPPVQPQPAAQPQPAPPAPAPPPRPDEIIGLVDILNRGPYGYEATMALVRKHLGDPGMRGWENHVQAIFGPLVSAAAMAKNQAGAQRLRNMATDLGRVLAATEANSSVLPALYKELNMAAVGVDFFGQSPGGDPQQLQQIMAQMQAQQPQPQLAPPTAAPVAPVALPPAAPAALPPAAPGPAPSADFIGPPAPQVPTLDLPGQQPSFIDVTAPFLGPEDGQLPQDLDFPQLQAQAQVARQQRLALEAQQADAKRKKRITTLVIVGVLVLGGAGAWFAFRG